MIPAEVRVHIRRLVVEGMDAHMVSALPDGIEADIASALAVLYSNDPRSPIGTGPIEKRASPLGRAIGSGIAQKIVGLSGDRR
jgi:hypothetical protein